MKRLMIILVLLVLLVGALWFLYTRLTQPAPRATDLLPQTTLLFVQAPNFAQSRAEFQQTAAYAVWKAPELQAMWEGPRQRWQGLFGVQGLDPKTAEILQEMFEALQGEVFLAVTHLTVIPNLQPGLVVGADIRARPIEARAGMTQWKRRLEDQRPQASFTKKRYLGVSYELWELRPNLVIGHTFLKSMLVFTWGENTLREVIARYTGQTDPDFPSLSASAKYQQTLKRMPAGHELFAYVNTEQILGFLGPLMALTSRGGGMLEKLDKIKASGTAFTFSAGAIQEVRFVLHSQPVEPRPPPTPQRTLSLATKDTSYYLSQTVDPPALYRDLMDNLAQLGRPGLVKRLAQFDRQISDVRDRVLASLGPEMAVMVRWREGMKFPDAALVFEVRDPEAVRADLDHGMRALKEATLGDDEKAPWDEFDQEGQTLHFVRFGSGRVAPTYTVTDHFLIAGLHPDYVGELLRGVESGENTLAANPAYTRAAEQLPQSAVSYTYGDLGAFVGPLVSLAEGLLNPESLGSETVAVPSLDVQAIKKHLFPFASATVVDDQGVTTTAYSPVSTPVIFLGTVAGAWVVAQQWLPAFDLPLIGSLPRSSSDTDAPPPPAGNRTAESQTPAPSLSDRSGPPPP